MDGLTDQELFRIIEEVVQEPTEKVAKKIPFQDAIKSNLFKRVMAKNEAASKDDDQFVFMRENTSLVSRRDKAQEYESFLKEQRYLHSHEHAKDKFKNVTAKINENRNPMIANFLKDVRTSSQASEAASSDSMKKTLGESLKHEFNIFMDQTVAKSADAVRSLSDKNSETRQDLLPVDNVFITQEADKEIADILKRDQDEQNKSRKESIKTTTSTKKSELKLPQIAETKKGSANKQELVESNYTNLQVALVDIDNEQKDGDTSLNKLKKLIDGIKKIDLPTFQPEFHQICQYASQPEILQYYQKNIAKELNVRQNGLGRYCVHECCVKGNVNLLKALLPYIEDVNKLDQNGQNPAHICCKYGELECLRILTANGLDLTQIDATGMTPLHVAALHNHPDIVEFLFEMGVPLNVRCQNGRLPFHYTGEYGSLRTLKKMCEYYLDVTIPDADGNTIAHLVVKSQSADRVDCLRYLVEQHQFPVDRVRNEQGRNVAHMCCLYGSVKCLHWLFEHVEIDPMNLDHAGNTLAHTACLGGQAECLNCCLQHDVPLFDVNSADETPLEVARKKGKSILMEKAFKNEIRCEDCVRLALEIKRAKEEQKTEGERILENRKSLIYNHKTITDSVSHTLNSLNFKTPRLHIKKPTAAELEAQTRASTPVERDFIAQYFGPDI